MGVAVFAGPSAADHGTDQHVVTIDDVTVTESDGAGVLATFNVTLSEATILQPVSVDYATTNGTATAGNDYSTTSGTITWLSTDSDTRTVTVPIVGDTVTEATEQFTVDLSNVSSNASIGDSQGTGTINDNDPAPELSIGNASAVTEGANATFAVTLSAPSSQTVTVQYSTADGSALAPGDYDAVSGSTVTFVPGDTSEAILISTNDDTLDEPDGETFTVSLAGPTNATIASGQGTGTGTINDNDAEPQLSISNVTRLEGNIGTTTFLYDVTLSAASGKVVTVNFATQNGTAVSGGIAPQNDYQHICCGSLTFNPGQTAKTISVLVNGDVLNEGNETFFVNLSGAVNANLPSTGGTGTITNDDGQPSLSVEDKTVNESVGTATFTVTLAPASGQTVTVNYATSDGPAPAANSPADYGASANLLSFAPTETTKTITVPIVQDALDEQNEKFTISLSNESNAGVSKRQGIGTITDDDSTPTVSIANAPAVAEGNPSIFTVTLSGASGQTVTVNYSTSNGTATAGTDYTAVTSGTVMFAPGETSKTVSITTADDALDEADSETFTVTISAPVNATLGTAVRSGTINDNDALPSISITDGSAFEGNSGLPATCPAPPAPGQTPTGCFFVTVSLSAASARQVTVQYSTANGTATAPADYASVSSTTLTFAPGGPTSQTIGVRISGDVADEANETVNVNLTTPTNATISDAQAVGTVIDDDGPPALSVSGAEDAENSPDGAIIVVALSPASEQPEPVTVQFSTASGTAISGSDFVGVPPSVSPCSGPAGSSTCTLTFTTGQTSKAIAIDLVDDALDEDDEAFTVNLSNPQNAVILNDPTTGRFEGRGQVTIADDDAPPSVSIADVTVTEGAGGSVNAPFAVTLSRASGKLIEVGYATANRTAMHPDDYVAAGGTLRFGPGETSKTVAVPVNGDGAVEPDEVFVVNLSVSSNASLADGEGVGMIVNDDSSPPPPPPPPPPAPEPTTSTTTSSTTTSTTTTTTTTSTRRTTTVRKRQVLTGMRISRTPVVVIDNLAPIGVTCSKRAKDTCFGTVVLQTPTRALAIVGGRPTARSITLGRESFAIPRGTTDKVLVPLSKRAVKALRRSGKLKVTAVVTARDYAGKRANPVRRAVWLKAKAERRAKR